ITPPHARKWHLEREPMEPITTFGVSEGPPSGAGAWLAVGSVATVPRRGDNKGGPMRFTRLAMLATHPDGHEVARRFLTVPLSRKGRDRGEGGDRSMDRRTFVRRGAAFFVLFARRAPASPAPVIAFVRISSIETVGHMGEASPQGLAETRHVEGQNLTIEF